MNEWKKRLLLFTSMLSPLALADWQLDIDFEMARAGKRHSTQTSVSLILGEETLLFDNNFSSSILIAKAELLDVTEAEITVALVIQEQNESGDLRTIMSPVIHAGLDSPALVNSRNDQLDEVASLKVAITV